MKRIQNIALSTGLILCSTTAPYSIPFTINVTNKASDTVQIWIYKAGIARQGEPPCHIITKANIGPGVKDLLLDLNGCCATSIQINGVKPPLSDIGWFTVFHHGGIGQCEQVDIVIEEEQKGDKVRLKVGDRTSRWVQTKRRWYKK